LIAVVLMMVCVFAGAFMVGQSRMAGFRWLRPVGAWLMMTFLTLGAAAVAAIFYGNNVPAVDQVLYQVFFWIYVVLAAEFIVNFVIEFYRPRTIGESRPVFESQLLSLFTEPGGVLRNIASALDYQFGFKVSGTWIYGFIERSFFPVLVLWALLLWGFTMIHEVGPNNVGVKERFGKVVSTEPLPEGIYWTLPYPFGDVQQFDCSEIRRIIIGETQESAEERSKSPVILWTNEHGGAKEPFIVAVKEPADERSGSASGSGASISFINMAIPIEYRIKPAEVMLYAYNGNVSPDSVLKKLGEQVVVEYLAGSTMDSILGGGRGDAEAVIKAELQKLADENQLGLEIIRVAIMDAHPPVENVAPAYQNVIASLEEKETLILKARADEYRIVPDAEARAYEIERTAKTRVAMARILAEAESERFAKQLLAFRSMKTMFVLNTMMEILETEGSNVRKFIVPSDLKRQVYQTNFETSERLDLVNMDVSELSDKNN
jgi:regulator of protease activity HflC (stomatin/prohibitin superfamily)